ncbi:MAG: helix-turn-helix transcriptional regulator [Gammaproteobacteria bacterium]|nr:helix-turn-helix transcriptional regulator [Gammaproteobacteria bacterium]
MKKGEITRLEILEATLQVMVDKGVHNTTFRAVADESGLKLSLVSYHFPDRTKLLRDAVAMLFSRQSVLIDSIFTNLYELLSQYQKRDLKRSISRAEIALTLTDAISEALHGYFLSDKKDPRALLVLKFDPHPDPALSHVRNLGLRSLKAYLIELCKQLHSATPRDDARLLTSVFVLFELEALKSSRPKKFKVHTAVWQVMCQILNVQYSLGEATTRVRKRQQRSFDNLLAQGELFS